MHNHQNITQQPGGNKQMTLSDALFQSTGIPDQSEQQSIACLPMECTPSSSGVAMPWINANNAVNSYNFMATYAPSSLDYWGLMPIGSHQQGLSASHSSPRVFTPGSTAVECFDSNSVVELAKRTIVLYRKSSSPLCSDQQSNKFFLNWVTKTFNLPVSAIQEVSSEFEVPSPEIHDPTAENTNWKMGFLVLDSSKTHDNIISMFEANTLQTECCYIRKGVDVLIEGRRSMFSSPHSEDTSSPPSNADLEDCFRMMSKTTRSISSSRSTPSSTAAPCTAFQSLFPYGSSGLASSGMAPAVQKLLDTYSTQYNAGQLANVQARTSTAANFPAQSVLLSPPNELEMKDSSSTTAALYKHIQKVTENSFWD